MSQKLILVLNCGSSSLKGAVLDNGSGEVLLSCLAEKLNLPDALHHIQSKRRKTQSRSVRTFPTTPARSKP
uniref:Acetate kinase n=1 Tax=Neisseria meningitidis alpha275 TaxID=295996 RepID=C6SHZ9_NEIME|nr:Acetate kinase [Neisseria meningitidis alpha275]